LVNNARPLSLKGRALRFLAQREHSRAELERKLAPHCPDDPAEPARTLDLLEARGLLSQARFVESVLHRRSARFGAARIRQELQAKGITGEALGEAVDRLRPTEFARARAVWARRFGTAAPDAAPDPGADPQAPPAAITDVNADARSRAAQMRFLMARGFPAEVVRQVIRGADADDDAADLPSSDD
jgi:regulatory protein